MNEASGPVTLRVGVSALIGAIGQLALLAVLEQGHAIAMLWALAILPPSVVPTICVAWSLARSRARFPGSPGWAVAFAVASWHIGALLLGAVIAADIHFSRETVPPLLSTAAAAPVAVAVWRLVRYWDWGYAFAMLGAGAAAGAVWSAAGDSPLLALATTVLWSTAVGLVAGLWLSAPLRSPN